MIRIAKDAPLELSVTRSSRCPGMVDPASLLRRARKAFRQLRNVFEDDLEQQGYIMVFGERLSLEVELENGGLRDIPQKEYLQTGGAIGIVRDRQPPPCQRPPKFHPRKHLAAPKPRL